MSNKTIDHDAMTEGKWQDAIGKTEESTELVNRKELAGLASVLGYPLPFSDGSYVLPWPDKQVPPFGHWLNANPIVSHDALDVDGHPATAGFVPNFFFPRRMWASSRVTMFAPYAVGQTVTHRKTIRSIEPKHGQSGEMIFVMLWHEYLIGDKLILTEEQNLIYRPAGSAPASIPEVLDVEHIKSKFDHQWFEKITPDPVWLMRYSSASFNSHRIHYDRAYAVEREYYPGLLVHGPLSASLLINLYQKNNPKCTISAFQCRATAPLYDIFDFYIMGKKTASGADLWAVGPDGVKAMLVSVGSE